MNQNKLFSPYKLGNMELKNRIVMAPMTRSRAIGNIPNDIMATYYEQRSDAGLIVTEGTSPSPNGLGYCRIPGIFSGAQVEGWKKITKVVHAKGGHIFLQIMHTGRISHSLNLPQGTVVLSPSAVKPAGQIWTDASGMQDFPTPKEMTPEEIELTKKEYVRAAKNVITAGFDGLELHGANGYLLEQFLSPHSNQRTDHYGGKIENRCRFVLEVVDGVCAAIGKEKIGIRLSPYGAASDMKPYPEIDATYVYLAAELNKRGIAYIHVVDHSGMGAPGVPGSIKKAIREKFQNTLILAGGYDKERAKAELRSGSTDLITFGRPFINNPDLVKRLMNDLPLAKDLDTKTFYSPGEKGYTDYPNYES
jgi:N-ethylmaleimide reductase